MSDAGGGGWWKGAPPHHHGSAPEGRLAGLSPGASAGPAPNGAGVSLGALERAHQPGSLERRPLKSAAHGLAGCVDCV